MKWMNNYISAEQSRHIEISLRNGDLKIDSLSCECKMCH